MFILSVGSRHLCDGLLSTSAQHLNSMMMITHETSCRITPVPTSVRLLNQLVQDLDRVYRPVNEFSDLIIYENNRCEQTIDNCKRNPLWYSSRYAHIFALNAMQYSIQCKSSKLLEIECNWCVGAHS